MASDSGHTEAIKALLTVPGIDVNHAAPNVSLRLLIPQHLVVEGEFNARCLTFSLSLTLTMMTYRLPTRNM